MIDDVNIAAASIVEDPLSTLFEKDNLETSGGAAELVNDNEFSENAEQCERSLMVFSPKPWQNLEDPTPLSSQESGNGVETDVLTDNTVGSTDATPLVTTVGATVPTSCATTEATSTIQSSAGSSMTTVTSINEACSSAVRVHVAYG